MKISVKQELLVKFLIAYVVMFIVAGYLIAVTTYQDKVNQQACEWILGK